MKEFFAVTVGFCLLFAGLSVVSARPAAAQGTPPASATKPAAPGRTRTIKDAARILEADAKIVVLAESSVARITVSLPPVGDAARPIEERLTELVAQLPRGTRWIKLELPAPPEGSRFRADDVADMVITQEKLFGAKGNAVAVTIQTVAERNAAAHCDLTPVYLILNSRAHAAMAFRGGEYAQMTAAQKAEWAKQAAESFRNLDPNTRLFVFSDMFKMPLELMKAATADMTPAEMNKFWTDMGAETKQDGNSGSISLPIKDE